MAQRVLKYPVPRKAECAIAMPVNARVLSFALQHDELQVWALVDDAETETQERRFVLKGTGHEIEPSFHMEFVGTVLMFDGDIVLHLFVEWLASFPLRPMEAAHD